MITEGSQGHNNTKTNMQNKYKKRSFAAVWGRLKRPFCPSTNKIKPTLVRMCGSASVQATVTCGWKHGSAGGDISPPLCCPTAVSTWTCFDFRSHFPALSGLSAHFLCVTAPFPVSVEHSQRDNTTATLILCLCSLFLCLFLLPDFYSNL